jgi:hypothetical protein
MGASSGRTRVGFFTPTRDGSRRSPFAGCIDCNPSWFYNARAHPDVLLGGIPFKAHVVEDEAARARLWTLADRVFPAFATYRESASRAGRTIPILQLLPRDDSHAAQ